MGFDLTLGIVPKQIETIFEKARLNDEYAEWISSIPYILKQDRFEDFGDEIVIELKKDTLDLKKYYKYSDSCFYCELTRCAASVDFLLNEYIQTNNISVGKDLIWKGGDKIAEKARAGQGIHTRVYTREWIVMMGNLFSKIEFSELKKYYNYSKMESVYKVVAPDELKYLKYTYNDIKKIFLTALEDDNLLILKEID